MPPLQHSAVPLGQNHGIAQWEYATDVARVAATGFTGADLHKVCFVADTQKYYGLVDTSPITWAKLSGELSVPSNGPSGGTPTGCCCDEPAEVAPSTGGGGNLLTYDLFDGPDDPTARWVNNQAFFKEPGLEIALVNNSRFVAGGFYKIHFSSYLSGDISNNAECVISFGYKVGADIQTYTNVEATWTGVTTNPSGHIFLHMPARSVIGKNFVYVAIHPDWAGEQLSFFVDPSSYQYTGGATFDVIISSIEFMGIFPLGMSQVVP